MREFYNKNKFIMNKFIMIICVFILIYVFVKYLFKFIAPFFIGFIISLILEPLVKIFSKKLGRTVGTILSIIFFISVILLLGTTVINLFLNQSKEFMQNMPIYISESTRTFSILQTKFENLLYFVPIEIRELLNINMGKVLEMLTKGASDGVKSGGVNAVTVLPQFMVGIVITLISTFFFIKDKYLIMESLAKIMPKILIEKWKVVKKGFSLALGGYVKAQLILMSVSGSICIFGLAILGYKYAFLIGFVIACVDALPLFGSGFILWPWALSSLIRGDIKMSIGLGIIYGSIILCRQLFEPKILGNQMGVHPLITLMSMYIGLQVFGVLGFIIGPITMVLIKSLLQAEDLEEIII